MGTERTRRISDLQFRVLVIAGRANAGEISILQLERVCETTESPKIYRVGEEVHDVDQISIREFDLTAD